MFHKPIDKYAEMVYNISESEVLNMKDITLKSLKSLKENDGITLENGKAVSYSKGYQVGISGIETTSPHIALKAVKTFNGNCGVWFSKNVFYVDKSIHIEDLQTAIEIGKLYNQQSIYDWETGECIWIS